MKTIDVYVGRQSRVHHRGHYHIRECGEATVCGASSLNEMSTRVLLKLNTSIQHLSTLPSQKDNASFLNPEKRQHVEGQTRYDCHARELHY